MFNDVFIGNNLCFVSSRFNMCNRFISIRFVIYIEPVRPSTSTDFLILAHCVFEFETPALDQLTFYDSSCFVVTRCGRLWESGSTGGRSSTPSGPGWPRPCPSPPPLHGSAFTALSSPRHYETEGRHRPGYSFLSCRHHFLPHHWSTLNHFVSWGRATERDCISLLNLRRDITQTWKWMRTEKKDTADFRKARG